MVNVTIVFQRCGILSNQRYALQTKNVGTKNSCTSTSTLPGIVELPVLGGVMKLYQNVWPFKSAFWGGWWIFNDPWDLWGCNNLQTTPLKTNSSHLKTRHPIRKVAFQASMHSLTVRLWKMMVGSWKMILSYWVWVAFQRGRLVTKQIAAGVTVVFC